MASGLLAAALTAGCSAGPAASSPATVDTCYAFAVQAIERHVIVTSAPQACAGLSHEQVNQAVARAIGKLSRIEPKAAARSLAYRDGAYLEHLIGTVTPAKPAAPPPIAPAGPSPGLPLSLAALGAWVATAAAGAYLLAGWLGAFLRSRGRGRERRRGRGRGRAADAATVFTVGHFGLALTGLGVWIGFVASGLAVLAWIAVVMVVVIAGLGMTVLASVLPEPGRSTAAAAGRARLPVTVIAAHGLLATVTILLVVLAAAR